MGEFAKKTVASMLLLAFSSYCLAQNAAPVLMRASGPVTVNGTQIIDSANLRENDSVDTQPTIHVKLNARGSSVAVGPNTHFVVLDNALVQDSGNTRVMTVTGSATKVKAYTVIPHDPTLKTDYEVNWEGRSVYVYARVGDVDIKGPCHDWKVEEGRIAKIENPWRCEPGVIFVNDPATTLKYASALAGVAGASVAAALLTTNGGSKMSADTP